MHSGADSESVNILLRLFPLWQLKRVGLCETSPSRQQVLASHTDTDRSDIQESSKNFGYEGGSALYCFRALWPRAGDWCVQLKRLGQSVLNCSWSSEVICLPALQVVLCFLKAYNNQLYPKPYNPVLAYLTHSS